MTTNRFHPTRMRPIDVAWVANRLVSEIDDRYVLPDTARQIAEILQARAGQIPPDIVPAELAALLTQWASSSGPGASGSKSSCWTRSAAARQRCHEAGRLLGGGDF